MLYPAVLYESPHLWVVDKPAGMQVELSLHGYPSVENWAQKKEQAIRNKKAYIGIVHRLDRPVAGVLLVARRISALRDLQADFEAGLPQKIYKAIVFGGLPKMKGTLEHWLKKDPESKMALMARPHARGAKSCVLHYEVTDAKDGFSEVSIQLETGRYHQIRAQLSAIGCPIVGDIKYGSKTNYIAQDHIALLAERIIFTEPLEKTILDIVSNQTLVWPQKNF
jgi:23S rRNA pseudouridine1911/1915/1917 synthase